MKTLQHSLSWQARALLLLACAPIIASAISFASALNLIGQPSIGVLLLWQEALRCHAVSPITPPSWPGMANGALQTGDCVEVINDIPAKEWPRYELERAADTTDGRNLAFLIVRRGNEIFVAQVTALRLTWLHVLQLQLGIMPLVLFVWTMALVVLLAQPRAEANRVFAALFFVLALAIAGLFHGLDDASGRYYTAFTIVSSMAWIGPLHYHLAFLTPRPVARFAPMRFALYPVGLGAMILHLDSMLRFVPLLQPWRGEAAWVASIINGLTLLIGLAMFLGRAGFWARRRVRPVADQMLILLISWAVGAGPLTLASSYYLLTYRAPLGTSFQPFLFFLVILCTGTAYVMLRYQSFAYRGRILNILTIIYLSAAIACAIMLFVLIGVVRMPVDGLVFTLLWSATFAATLIWHTDNPFRRLYRRFFLRHQHHYQATFDFAMQMGRVSDLDVAAQQGAELVRSTILSDWVAVHLFLTPDRVWLATATTTEQRQVSAALHHSACLPETPAIICPLASKGEQMGILYVGPRNVSEPLDEEDERLVGLLATLLANAVQIQAHIQRLAATPKMIITAQEQERERIAQEIHDSVMPFLGALPLGLMQIEKKVQMNAPVDTIIPICEAYRERAAGTAKELRSIMRHLQPPLVGATHLGLAILAFTQEICSLYNVEATINGAEIAYPLDEFTARHAYRIIQQAITNALQHARPTALEVSISAHENGWTCRVNDNGSGFDLQQPPHRQGFGLFSMRERARIIGATLEIDSHTGHGTTVTLRVEKGTKIGNEAQEPQSRSAEKHTSILLPNNGYNTPAR